MGKYIVGIDQSTQGTKALLLDEDGKIKSKTFLLHKQIISDQGWVSHDLSEIYFNSVQCIKKVIEEAGIKKDEVAAIGISNQRETTAMWSRVTGVPCTDAVVWQCSRAGRIAVEVEELGCGDMIKAHTGISLSPYFPAAKMAWLLRNVDNGQQSAEEGKICLGTIDSWLVYKMTGGKSFITDYSNASRTQLFNIHSLTWDDELLKIFNIPKCALPIIQDSDGLFGETDLDGCFSHPIPIHGVMGDSHAALFGQGCLESGMIKATYGTGSSIMMNIGQSPVMSEHGVVTSLAWRMNGKTDYVLEGNINNAGSVITWLKDELGIIQTPEETAEFARQAKAGDSTYFVPAFTGFGAPYWDPNACAVIYGMGRTTGKMEIVRAALECIAYQIKDIIIAMEKDSGIQIEELRVDGSATKNPYLMQFQSDILNKIIKIPQIAELSAMGAAYAAGIGIGFYQKENLFKEVNKTEYFPHMTENCRAEKYNGWKKAVYHASNRKQSERKRKK